MSHGDGNPVFQQRVNWSEWAAHADPRDCEGCGTTFKPNHPRRRFCGKKECNGRKPPPPRRRRASGRAQAAARAAGVQGFLADVLMATHSGTGTDREINAAFIAFHRAVRRQDDKTARSAAVRLAAAGAIRAVKLAPPPLRED